MATIKELKENRAKVVDRSKARIDAAEKENRNFTADEDKAHAADRAEIELLNARIQRQQDASVWEADNPEAGSQNPQGTTPRHDPDHHERITVTPMRHRFAPLRNFPNTPAGEEQAYRAGMWAMATIFNKADAKRWCQDAGIKIEMAQTEGTNTAGGYLVIPEFERSIIDVRDQFGSFGRMARMKPMSSPVMSQPKRTGGPTATWEDEGDTVSDTSKSWTQVGMQAKRMSALVLCSRELEQDAIINVVDDLSEEIGYAMAYKEDLAGWLGDGTSTYGGFTGVITKINDGNYTNSIVTAATGNTAFSTLDNEDFLSMIGKLPEYAQPGAAWYISRPGWAASMARLEMAAGGNTKDDIRGGQARQYAGYPVNFVPVMNTTLTAQTSATGVCLFGDLRMAANIGRLRGLVIEVLRELYAASYQIGVIGHQRVSMLTHTLSTPSPNVTGAGPLISLSLPGS